MICKCFDGHSVQFIFQFRFHFFPKSCNITYCLDLLSKHPPTVAVYREMKLMVKSEVSSS